MADRQSLWMVYMRGWSHGATSRALDPACTQHDDPEIRRAYDHAYEHGRDARRVAAAHASRFYGYTPSPFRGEPTPGEE